MSKTLTSIEHPMMISEDALETVEVDIDNAYVFAERARVLEELFELQPHLFHEEWVKAKIAEYKRRAQQKD